MLRILLAICSFWAAAIPNSLAAPRPMSPVDFVEMPRLSAGVLSPDGSMLAYLRSETDWQANQHIQRLQLIHVETGEKLPVPAPHADDDPTTRVWWAPDSSGFIYLRKPDGGEKRQAHFFELATQETTQWTAHGESLTGIYWRPDGSGFYFTSAQQQPASDTRLLASGWIIPPFEADANREIWSFDLATGTATPVVQGPYSVRQLWLSRDGETLLHSRVPTHQLDVLHFGEVIASDAAGNDKRRLTQNAHSEIHPQLSPDGSRLAYIATVNARGEPFYEPKLFVQPLGGTPQRLLADQAMEALDFAWDQTGDGLYILANTGLSADLFHYQLADQTLRQLTAGDHNLARWTYLPDIDAHLAQIESAAGPGEWFVMRDAARGFEQVTQDYRTWESRFDLPVQERVTWRGRRGVTLEGLLVYPTDYQSGTSYPLVTITHGGPHTSTRFGSWNATQYLPVLANAGYMVFLPNHRGGTGYGDTFMRDMAGRYFRYAHHDVMDGIDALIDRGLADPDQLIKMGWSAGGHMVNKLITQSNRFKAASSGAGVADWLSMHGESDVRHARRFIFGGVPWQRRAPRQAYTRDSPLRDVWKVTTPTLFFTGADDVRVPPTQSILMHRGVRATGTPTVLYQAEDEGHSFRKPANQLFKINTELDWYAHFALNASYEPVLPDEAYAVDPAPIAQAGATIEATETASP